MKVPSFLARLKTASLWIPLWVLFIANALTSHISVSEFWPISLSKEIWNFSSPEFSVFYKPVFHVVLSFLYFFNLDNLSHILGARLIFGTFAVLNVFLFLKWLEQIGLIFSRKSRLFALFVLVFSPLFFSQIIKVRSDILSLFFTLLFLGLATRKPPPWKTGHFLILIAIHFSLLGTTPRAFFHSLIALSFLVPHYWDALWKKETRNQVFLVTLAPILSFLIIFFPVSTSLGSLLINYFKTSYEASGFQFETLWVWIKQEFLILFWIFLSFAFFLFSNFKKKMTLVFPFMAALTSFFLADLKTPYLIASLFPFLLLPILGWLSTLEFKTKWLGFISGSVLMGSLFTTQSSDWWSSNSDELEVIQKISSFMRNHPELTFFDGLGIFPRANQIVAYLGPNDHLALNGAARALTDKKPDLVLYTSRFHLLSPDMTTYLLSHYEPIAPNFFIRKDLPIKVEKFEFRTPPVLLFHLNSILPKD